jgi:alkylation response protein AidB-like acyl-CoA dehydrogenase
MIPRTLFDDTHDEFRASVRRFYATQVAPRYDEFERAGIVDRAVFGAAGDAGFLGFAVPEAHGGAGVRDFRFNAVLGEEAQAAGLASVGLGLTLHTDICLPYFLDLTTEEQKRRWLPGIASGELITAVAMTEPGTGSDLAGITTTARRDGEDWIVSGAKTFITNGINADLVIVAVKTDPSQRHRGVSLLVVERDMAGFERGRNLDKLGLHGQDTAELFFTDVRVPGANLLGAEGMGFRHLTENLAQERLSIAVAGLAAARAALDATVAYGKERTAFGTPIGSFQSAKFRLAELATEVAVGQAFVDRCIEALNDGILTVEDAAMAKLWCTELQGRAVDLGVQLHGGYGYMAEYPIARAFTDARVTRIYGGTSEVMKEIVGRSLGL